MDQNQDLKLSFSESTVVETYRIHELAFHLQLTEQLPPGATMNIVDDTVLSSVVDQTKFEEASLKNLNRQGHPSVLDSIYIGELKHSYMCTYPQCLTRDEVEGGSGKEESSCEFCKGFSNSITMFTRKEQHGRHIKFGSVLSEREDSIRVSSYTYLRKTSSIFGHIQFMFEMTRYTLLHVSIGMMMQRLTKAQD